MQQDPIMADSNIIGDVTAGLYTGHILLVTPIMESEELLSSPNGKSGFS